MTYDRWKTTNPADEFLGPDPREDEEERRGIPVLTRPGKRRATYDEKCWDLAEAFLEDEPALATFDRTDKLAALIQRTIEDFIAHERDNYDGPPDDGEAWSGGFAENH